MARMIIDSTNLILGRLASFIAKKALMGETMELVNCEKAVITGNKKTILKLYLKKMKSKSIRKGPFIPKTADRFVRRSIRGMLPYKTARGREAFKRVICHVSIPEKLKDKKIETIEGINIGKLANPNHVKIKEICNIMGGK